MCFEPAEVIHATGQRRDWSELPKQIVADLEEFLGDQVITASTMHGGFSPGIAARVTTSSGQHVFVKAVSAEINTDAAKFHRREIRIATGLNSIDDLPVPRILWSWDEPDSPWVVLAFENVDGRQPKQPWIDSELNQVIAAMDRLSDRLTPSPLGPPVVPLARNDTGVLRNHWQHRIENPVAGLDDWSTRNLLRLAELSEGAADAVDGATLLHMDLRADNMLLTIQGEILIVDWPHAGIGAPWLDPMFMAPSVELNGGPKASEFFSRFRSTQNADPEAVTIALAATAGFFISQSLEPDIPGLPGLRSFQAAQGRIARTWLAERLGLD